MSLVLVVVLFFVFLMIRLPPRSTRTDTSFPTRRSSDLVRPRQRPDRAIEALCGRDTHLSAPPLAACRRLRADGTPARRDGADPQWSDEGPDLHRMGQGRYRRAGADEGGCAGAGPGYRKRVVEGKGGSERLGKGGGGRV